MAEAGGAATSVEELLPGMTGATGSPNQAHIQQQLRAHAPLDMEHAVRWVGGIVQTNNGAKIAQLGTRLGAQQSALLRTANEVEPTAPHLEQLVRLNQRLQHLVENIDLVENTAEAQVGRGAGTYRTAANRWQAEGAGSLAIS